MLLYLPLQVPSWLAGLRWRYDCATPKGAPPAIPPIIITPFNYGGPTPAIDPPPPPPHPPVSPPSAPAVSRGAQRIRRA